MIGMAVDIDSEFDVVIVGGGMVGAAQALALCQQNKKVLLLEKQLPQPSWLEQPPLRVSAINLYSETFLTSIGAWQHITPMQKCVFNRLATWEQRSVGLSQQKVMFSADDIDKSHLGYLVRNEALQMAAFTALNSLSNPPQISDAELVAINNNETHEQQLVATLKREAQVTQVKCQLLIGADGANSRVRQLAGIGVSGWDYQQHCLSLTIKTDFPSQDITWQEFQPSGPKAFLPLSDGFASLIWYDEPSRIKQLKNLDQTQLKQQVLATFPELPGDFSIVQQASFPLTRRQAKRYVAERVVLVGDAAHTINPLAGQGVNLGYKDVAELSALLSNVDLAEPQNLRSALTKYQFKRKAESLLMSSAMDSFYTLFSNNKSVHKWLRTGLLATANKLPWAKKQVLMKAVGY